MRSQNGWALIAVMTVSVFATMFLFSLAGLSVSLLQTEGASRQRNYALAAAEAGLDFARLDLNKTFTGEVSILTPAENEPYKDHGLETKYLPQLGNSCRVMIRVSPVDDATKTSLSSLKSPTLPDYRNSSQRKDVDDWLYGDDWQRFSIKEDTPCWKVEVTGYCGVFATSIRSILVAAYDDAVHDDLPQRPYFQNLISADGAVELGSGNSSMMVQSPGKLTTAEDGGINDQVVNKDGISSMKASIQSNGSIRANPLTTIFADLRVSNPGGASKAVASTGGNQSLIFGRVETNTISGAGNAIDGATANPGPQASVGDNVLASADQLGSAPPITDSSNLNPLFDYLFGEPVARQGTNSVPLEPGSSLSSQAPNPVPTPSNLPPLPPFPIPPPNETSYEPPNPPVPAGSYTTASLDSSNASEPLQFNTEQGPNVTTKIYIQDPLDASSPAVNLNSSALINNKDASALQIYYAGNRPVNIKLDGNLKVVIYAPNASVETSGTGDFSGAIVGKEVKIKHTGKLELDPGASLISAAQNSDYDPNSNSGVPDRPFSHFQVMTWQQVSGSLVPFDG